MIITLKAKQKRATTHRATRVCRAGALLGWCSLACFALQDSGALAFSGDLEVQAQFWTSTCTAQEEGVATCSVPQPLGAASTATVAIAEAPQPGQASARHQQVSFVRDQKPLAMGQITLVSVNPHAHLNQPNYLQIQWQSVLPGRSECMQSVRWRESFEAPPLICSSIQKESGEQYRRDGVTLTFEHKKAVKDVRHNGALRGNDRCP